MTWDRVDGAWTALRAHVVGRHPGAALGRRAGSDAARDRRGRDRAASRPRRLDESRSSPDEQGDLVRLLPSRSARRIAAGAAIDRFRAIGAAKSADRGLTWQDLGVILEAPPDSDACASSNRFVLGGVGDVSVMLDAREAGSLSVFQPVFARSRRSGRRAGAAGVGRSRRAGGEDRGVEGRGVAAGHAVAERRDRTG